MRIRPLNDSIYFARSAVDNLGIWKKTTKNRFRPPVRPGTMTNTALEAIASLSGKNCTDVPDFIPQPSNAFLNAL